MVALVFVLVVQFCDELQLRICRVWHIDNSALHLLSSCRRTQDYHLETYDIMLGPLMDYAELVADLGYVTMFAAAMPVLPLLALLSNSIQLRADLWKLLFLFRSARTINLSGCDFDALFVLWFGYPVYTPSTCLGALSLTGHKILGAGQESSRSVLLVPFLSGGCAISYG